MERLFQKFRRGKVNFEDKKGHGRQPSVEEEKLKTLTEANLHKTVTELERELLDQFLNL